MHKLTPEVKGEPKTIGGKLSLSYFLSLKHFRKKAYFLNLSTGGDEDHYHWAKEGVLGGFISFSL